MKRLVVCCDGTWQRVYEGALTNVALTARSVSPRDEQGHPQIVYYSAGVGATLDHLSAWQGITGDDLDDHLLNAYMFLIFNYEPNDPIYLFGFSRGAYTVRSLAGLLRKCGILRREHVDKADDALTLYRNQKIGKDSAEAMRFRAAHALAWPRLDCKLGPFAGPPVDLSIRYLGVWDTVGSLGIPSVLPIHLGLSARYQFHDLTLSRAVEYARHAVAIDERRAAFKPTLWTNLKEFNPRNAPPRALQQWFPGDHGGVGGGGKSQGLSNCSLMWVLEGAEQAGLSIKREPGTVISACLAEIDPIEAPLGNNGFSVLDLMGTRWRKGLHHLDDVHEAAQLRWAANHGYRPPQLKPFGARILEAVQTDAASWKAAG
jgi:uncharacterized protein (DUF2235 family)